MVEWLYPLWFLALPLALLPLWAGLRPHTLRYSSLGAVQSRRTIRSFLPLLPSLLESIALICMVTALARPQIVNRETQRESQGIDILMAVDTSGSMESPDMGTRTQAMSRLEAAKLVMRAFVDERPDDRLGLVLFGQEAFVQVPLTLDHEALSQLLGDVEIGMAGKNATAVGTAIAIATKNLKELTAPSRILILVTDGKSNAGTVTPIEAARAAAALGIRIYTIGVGATSGRGLMGLLGGGGADVDEPTLRQIADLTGGRYYRATDAEALSQVYAEINSLEKTTAKVKEFTDPEELYLRYLLPALACSLLSILLSNSWLRRLP
jgi:Ca-activated chloride channel homolog